MFSVIYKPKTAHSVRYRTVQYLTEWTIFSLIQLHTADVVICVVILTLRSGRAPRSSCFIMVSGIIQLPLLVETIVR